MLCCSVALLSSSSPAPASASAPAVAVAAAAAPALLQYLDCYATWIPSKISPFVSVQLASPRLVSGPSPLTLFILIPALILIPIPIPIPSHRAPLRKTSDRSTKVKLLSRSAWRLHNNAQCGTPQVSTTNTTETLPLRLTSSIVHHCRHLCPCPSSSSPSIRPHHHLPYRRSFTVLAFK